MTMNAEEIGELLNREGSGLTPDEYEEANEPDSARERRTELLAPVLSACQQLWYAGSEEIDLVAEKLGDGSRDVAWRLPFGESGILAFFLGVNALDPLRPALQLHTLRLIGNSCADTDENRARVVEGSHMMPIIRRVQDETLIPFTIPVLYNILVDYEPAQLCASQANLNHYLTTLLSSPTIANYTPFVSYICKTLTLLSTQECEAGIANPMTVHILLNMVQDPTYASDVQDFISLATAASSYLASPVFQANMITGAELPPFLNAIYQAHTFFTLEQMEGEEDQASLKEMRTALQKALADVTAHDDFPVYHPLGTPVPQMLLSWLQAPDQVLKSAACLALGNLSRSDEASTALVYTYAAHKPLIELISNPQITDPQVLHSALSFLKNLAIPAQNKATLGDLLQVGCVPRIYSLDTLPQVQFAAVSLTRLLILGCPVNVQRVTRRLTTDKWSPSYERTMVNDLCSIFDRTDAEPTKVEAARAVLTVCRVLHSNPVRPILVDWDPENPEDVNDDEKRRQAFWDKVNPVDPLSFLITQTKWPVLRSEAWFVLALMARTRDGGGVVVFLTHTYNVIAAMISAITGRPADVASVAAQLDQPTPSDMSSPSAISSPSLALEPQQTEPSQAADMARVDRENAIVMTQEMMRHWSSEMPQLRASIFHDLIKEGTQIIAEERARTIG